MAKLDIAILVVIALSAGIGLVRGLVKEVLSLLSWIIAFVVAIYFAGTLAGYLPDTWGSATVRSAIAFVVLFITTLIATSILRWLVTQLVEVSGLSGTDRLLGFVFGSARGVLVCIVVLIGLRQIVEETSWWQASFLAPELLAFEGDLRELMGRAREIVDEVEVPDV